MKKILILILFYSSIVNAQFIQFIDEEYTQISIWNDPVVTFQERMPQFGVDITKVMLWGWISASVSHANLNVGYTDLIGSGGFNLKLANYDPVRYYAGPRMGFIFREGNGFPLWGGVIGFDWRISRPHVATKFHIGARAWIDYREDQKDQFYGASAVYKPGLITNNPLLQENGAIVISFSW